uniref:MADF domain-containing protein n=1 Tax=Caenorhabditis japonica TaxID=281687 RepID=A0A8R1DH44_CAEJA
MHLEFRQCPAHTKNQTTKASSASKKSIDFPTVKRGRKEKAKPTDSIFTYTEGDVIEFIERVEAEPAIWDSTNSDFHRKEARQGILIRIENDCSRFMPKIPRYHGRVAHEKWVKLSKAFTSHTMRIRKAASGSGMTDLAPDFKYAPYLTFLNYASRKREVKK